MDAELFARHGSLKDLRNLGSTNTAAKKFNLVDLVHGQASLLESLVNGEHNAVKNAGAGLLDFVSAKDHLKSDVVEQLGHLDAGLFVRR